MELLTLAVGLGRKTWSQNSYGDKPYNVGPNVTTLENLVMKQNIHAESPLVTSSQSLTKDRTNIIITRHG